MENFPTARYLRAFLIGMVIAAGAVILLAPLPLVILAPHRRPYYPQPFPCDPRAHHCGPFYSQG